MNDGTENPETQTEQSTYLGSFSGKTTAIDAAEVLALLIETEGYTASTACTLAAAREQIVAQPVPEP